jgi:N-sulfoglucosamine sulfohydrolase
MTRCLSFLLASAFVIASGPHLVAAEKVNLLIITVDDMSADSIGAFGCRLPGTSPNIDRLAAQGFRFRQAHVQVGNCMPSRNVMWSGRYPHNNGVEGFYQVPNPGYPVLADLMQQAGYFTAIRHKVSHSTPYSPYPSWDVVLDDLPDGSRAHVKDPESYGVSTARGIEGAKAQGKPFCLVINIADPHKPFYAQAGNGDTTADAHVPSRVFTPDEPPTPGFLFEDPVVSKELSHYYSSVRRADDGAGHILKALEDSGQADNTLVMFLSDHGMPLPFAKTQLYHHSTHTPLIIRWPGVTRPGAVDEEHMVSAVDFLPTLLDVLGLAHPEGMDGRSFAPLLKGESQDCRDLVVKEYNENAGGSRDPMRAIQTKKLLYIFNPWSNGERIMATATTGTPTYRRMAELAKTDEWIATRHDLYQHRVVEELYDIEKDPDCLANLIASPDHQEELAKLRTTLDSWMAGTGDPMLDVFRHRDDPAAREAYVAGQEKEAEARKPKRGEKKPARAGRKRAELISLETPKRVAAGVPVTVRVNHDLEAELGAQLVHVTFKGGKLAKRLDRKVVEVSGSGMAEVTFELPADVPDNLVSFAAFIGKDYPGSLQHLQSDLIPVNEAQP